MSANQMKIVDKIISARIDLDSSMCYLERIIKFAEEQKLDNSTDAAKIKLKQDILAILLDFTSEYKRLYYTMQKGLSRLGVER